MLEIIINSILEYEVIHDSLFAFKSFESQSLTLFRIIKNYKRSYNNLVGISRIMKDILYILRIRNRQESKIQISIEHLLLIIYFRNNPGGIYWRIYNYTVTRINK